MSATATVEAPPAEEKRFRWRRLIVLGVVVVVVGAAAELLGWDIRGWFKQLWDVMSAISIGYLIGAVGFKVVQTTLVAYAYWQILKFAYPDQVRWREIYACYAASVALNNVVPANLGSLVLLIMFTQIVPGLTFAGSLAVYGVQKIFFMLIGMFTYLYLFLTVGGSFDLKFGFIKAHPAAVVVLCAGIGLLVYYVIRVLWPKILKWWEEAKEGGQILAHPRLYLTRVFAPELGAWLASLGVMSMFLLAYDIPVTFHTLMRLCGGNSIASTFSVTPGGVGVTQAANVASLSDVATTQQATAYSVSQQLCMTAWNITFAIVLMCWAFGWSGGKRLVGESYAQAKEKEAERKAKKRAAKEATG
jgi:uncharacterized membrane protein YbhN (UPF0104 family)